MGMTTTNDATDVVVSALADASDIMHPASDIDAVVSEGLPN